MEFIIILIELGVVFTVCLFLARFCMLILGH